MNVYGQSKKKDSHNISTNHYISVTTLLTSVANDLRNFVAVILDTPSMNFISDVRTLERLS